MAYSFDQLIEPVTPEEVQDASYKALTILGSETTSWLEGSVVRTIIETCAQGIASLSDLQAEIVRSGFLAKSEGDWLTAVALYVYGCERFTGSFATGTLTLTNPSGGSYVIQSGDWVFENPTTGAQFRNSTGFTLTPNSTTTVDVEAVEIGSGSTCSPGTITRVSTGSSEVQCSNPSELVGVDEEQDSALIIRCSEKLGSLSPNGPWDAYSYASRNAKSKSGRPLGVQRIQITKNGYGDVFVYLATASGPLPGSLSDADSDLYAADAAMQRGSTPICVRLNTRAAIPHAIAVDAVVYSYDTTGKSEQEIKDLVAQAVIGYFSQLPIGGAILPGATTGKVYRDHLIAVISNVLPEIFHVDLQVPASDVELLTGEVPILQSIAPVSDVVFTSPSEGWQQPV